MDANGAFAIHELGDSPGDWGNDVVSPLSLGVRVKRDCRALVGGGGQSEWLINRVDGNGTVC